MKYLLTGEETTRLSFKKVSEDDFAAWLPFFEEPASFKYWKTTLKPPVEECQHWYNKQLYRYKNDSGGMNALFNRSTNELIGHCGLLLQEVDGVEELEIAYSLLPSAWNKGYATEAAAKCKSYAFENNFADSLISIISTTNLPSEKVALKNGMKLDKTTVYNDNDVNIFRITKEAYYMR